MAMLSRLRRVPFVGGVTMSLLVAACGPPRQAPPPDASLIADPPAPGSGAPSGASLTAYDRGTAYVKSGAFADALPLFEQAIAADPKNAKAVYFRGLCLEQLGKPAEAEKAYREAMKLDAKLVEPRINLAAMLMSGEKPVAREAVKVLEPAAEADPGAADVREALADAYYMAGSAAKATAQYQAAVKLEPTALRQYKLGQSLFKEKKRDAAADALREALKGIDEAQYIEAIAGMFVVMKKWDDCVAAYGKAIGKSPKKTKLYVRRGLCQHSRKDEPKAQADFRKAIEIDPKHQAAHFYLGVSYSKHKELKKGIEHLKTAVKLGTETRIGKMADKQLAKIQKQQGH